MYKPGIDTKIFIITLLMLVLPLKNVFSQDSENKSAQFPYVYATYSLLFPGGDLSERFGISSEIGGGAGYKTQTNWMVGLEASYIFGPNVKENPLEPIINSEGEITNMYGESAQINLREAGMQLKMTAGKIFSFGNINPNSGIFIRAGLGFLQHKIYIENLGNNTPQVLGDYRKGYDRMCNGLSTSECVGWQNFSDQGAYHFLVGFECTQAFTQNRRAWDYTTNSRMDEKRLDIIYTLKAAWFIPFHQKPATGYYYY